MYHIYMSLNHHTQPKHPFSTLISASPTLLQPAQNSHTSSSPNRPPQLSHHRLIPPPCPPGGTNRSNSPFSAYHRTSTASASVAMLSQLSDSVPLTPCMPLPPALLAGPLENYRFRGGNGIYQPQPQVMNPTACPPPAPALATPPTTPSPYPYPRPLPSPPHQPDP